MSARKQQLLKRHRRNKRIALALALLGLLPPWLAAIGMSLSSLLVVLNAGRLRRLEG